jgi:hypothetical protein
LSSLRASHIYADPGTVWETDRIAVKAYAAMGLLHAATGAVLQLRSEDKVGFNLTLHTLARAAICPTLAAAPRKTSPAAEDMRAISKKEP